MERVYLFILFIVGIFMLNKMISESTIIGPTIIRPTIIELQNGQNGQNGQKIAKEGFWINYTYDDRTMEGPRYGPLPEPNSCCSNDLINGIELKRYINGSLYSPERVNVNRHGDRTWWNTNYLNKI